ncbi:MAG: hypothetical protein JSR18_15810 [Proteobacteria bacterium]|nr:hypothetical protein [Pseudomonadota bacterium]
MVDADALRYRVLMRLAPALRHGFAGQIQAVYFTGETVARRVGRAATLDDARAAVAPLPEQAKTLSVRAQPLLRWLRPDAQDRLPLDRVVDEVCELMNVDLSLREIVLERDGGSAAEVVAMPWLQSLAAGMLAVGDRCGAGATLALATSAHGIAITRRGPTAAPAANPYLVAPDDAAALATACGLVATVTTDGLALAGR